MHAFQLGTFFTGCLNIRPTLSFEETVAEVAEALGVNFLPDQEGKYEEYPAYRAFVLGLELALLAPPLPKFDTRAVQEDIFQLIIHSDVHVTDVGVNVDLTALVEAQLVARTKLVVERL